MDQFSITSKGVNFLKTDPFVSQTSKCFQVSLQVDTEHCGSTGKLTAQRQLLRRVVSGKTAMTEQAMRFIIAENVVENERKFQLIILLLQNRG